MFIWITVCYTPPFFPYKIHDWIQKLFFVIFFPAACTPFLAASSESSLFVVAFSAVFSSLLGVYHTEMSLTINRLKVIILFWLRQKLTHINLLLEKCQSKNCPQLHAHRTNYLSLLTFQNATRNWIQWIESCFIIKKQCLIKSKIWNGLDYRWKGTATMQSW